jgi:hypothetical protein
MPNIQIPGEFLGSDGAERAKMCRKLAAEAEALAAAAINPESREAYVDLTRQWHELASEFEKGTETPDAES